MDVLDILAGHYYQTHSARYFNRLPESISYAATIEDMYKQTEAIGIDIDFEFVDPTSWRYKTLVSNMSDSNAADATIKTKDGEGMRVKGYILLDNGRLMQIISITEDTAAVQREAARIFAVPPGTDYVIRLVEIENPWGII